jgi:hypothetical protein
MREAVGKDATVAALCQIQRPGGPNLQRLHAARERDAIVSLDKQWTWLL